MPRKKYRVPKGKRIAHVWGGKYKGKPSSHVEVVLEDKKTGEITDYLTLKRKKWNMMRRSL